MFNSGNSRGGGDGKMAKRGRAPITRETVKVTPEVAKAWLDANNSTNRNLRWWLVQEYAERMERGEWHLNGDPLKFDADGMIFEGQHRLHAVILFGKPVEFDVMRGLPASDRFNSGGQPRTLADCLTIAGIVEAKHGARAVSLVEVIGSLIDGEPACFSQKRAADIDRVLVIAREYQSSIKWAIDIFGGTYAPVVGAIAFAHHAKPQATIPFGEHYASKERSAGQPVTVLNTAEKSMALERGRAVRLSLAQKTLAAIYAAHKNRKLTKLQRSDAALVFFGASTAEG